MSNVLTEAEGKLREIADEFRVRLDEVVQQHLPVVHDAAQTLERLSQSAIVTEVVNLTAALDPAAEQAIALLIRGAGEAAAKIAELTAPPAETPADQQVAP